MGLFARRRRIGVISPILFGVGGAALGATLAFFLTPSTGSEAREFVRNLWRRNFERSDEDSIDQQLDSMESEGGLMGSSSGRMDTHS